MKAIYQGRLWQVIGDDADGLILAPMGWGTNVRAAYSAPDLVLDPTDDEVAEVTPPAAGESEAE